MDQAILGLKSQILAEVDRNVASLEVEGEVCFNQVYQETAATLQEIKDLVEATQESQEKMWRVVEGMSKELEELAQGDVGTNGEEYAESGPMSSNLVEERQILRQQH